MRADTATLSETAVIRDTQNFEMASDQDVSDSTSVGRLLVD